ncbi:DUF6931 family protein [Xanthobacter oligotrophicus]|uniref:DUF6931 family protein n=1 Tax=Xanthobacter oligotrophicus TaxID=2607286 RepID=UPI0011F2FA6B|nr:hypothetical protein [Xanthobacter oligotrophicus]MCG5233954.1 hypothetical protein [Xanthobacter oligotrophicus]
MTLRFPVLRGLYEAFPTAVDDVGIPAGDDDCLDLLGSLATAAAWTAAISLCAYILPRREAVWWGCQSLRAMQPPSPHEAVILEVAEAWVRRPDEPQRRAALDLGTQSDASLPATWMAFAAAWSGGSIVPPEYACVPAPPEQTARSVRAGLMIAVAQLPEDLARDILKPCMDAGIQIVSGPR